MKRDTFNALMQEFYDLDFDEYNYPNRDMHPLEVSVLEAIQADGLEITPRQRPLFVLGLLESHPFPFFEGVLKVIGPLPENMGIDNFKWLANVDNYPNILLDVLTLLEQRGVEITPKRANAIIVRLDRLMDIELKHFEAVLRFLLDRFGYIDHAGRTEKKMTLLMHAVARCDLEKVGLLLRLGADPNRRLANTDRALLVAAGGGSGRYFITGNQSEKRRIECARQLLQAGADLDYAPQKNNTAVFYAKKNGFLKLTAFLENYNQTKN